MYVYFYYFSFLFRYYVVVAYTPGWNDPPLYSFEDTVSACQENRPKIFDRIPARVLSNSQVPQQVNLDKNQIPPDNRLDSNENTDDIADDSSIQTSSISDIPVEDGLSYVMTSLKNSIQKSTLLEVHDIMIMGFFFFF